MEFLVLAALIHALNLGFDVRAQIVLFRLLPAVSVPLDRSQRKQALFLSQNAILAHRVNAADQLHSLSFKRWHFDRLPLLFFGLELLSLFGGFSALLLCLFKCLLFLCLLFLLFYNGQ